MQITFSDICFGCDGMIDIETKGLVVLLSEGEEKWGTTADAARQLRWPRNRVELLLNAAVPACRPGRVIFELSVDDCADLSMHDIRQQIRFAVIAALDQFGAAMTGGLPPSRDLGDWLDIDHHQVRRYRIN